MKKIRILLLALFLTNLGSELCAQNYQIHNFDSVRIYIVDYESQLPIRLTVDMILSGSFDTTVLIRQQDSSRLIYGLLSASSELYEKISYEGRSLNRYDIDSRMVFLFYKAQHVFQTVCVSKFYISFDDEVYKCQKEILKKLNTYLGFLGIIFH